MNENQMNESSSVVVPHQDEIRVFVNSGGGITIIAEDFRDDPACVAFRAEHAEQIIKAIKSAVSEIKGR